jgi:bacteriorhodopsin
MNHHRLLALIGTGLIALGLIALTSSAVAQEQTVVVREQFIERDATYLQHFLQYALFVASFAFLAATVYFLIEKPDVRRDHQPITITSALITLVAALSYFYMSREYVPGQPFPIHYRYIDWTITTPLLLGKFMYVLGLGRRGRGLFLTLAALDLWMIVFGFVADLAGPGTTESWIWYTVSWLGYIGILVLMFVRLTPLARDSEMPKTFLTMRAFVVFGWLVYPIAFVLPTLGVATEVRDLSIAIADMANKILFGYLIHQGSRALTEHTEGVSLQPMTRSEAEARGFHSKH